MLMDVQAVLLRIVRWTTSNCRPAFLLIAASLILSTVSPAKQANPAPSSQVPDVLVWIDATRQAGTWVSVTYPKVVQRAQAEDHLRRLLAETGWTASNVRISEGSVTVQGENPMTSAEFMVPQQSLALESGVLPVEPFIEALRDLKNIELLYIVPQGFAFQGLADFENKYVKITLKRGSNSYRYAIIVKRSDFRELGLPRPGIQAQPPADAEEKGGMNAALVGLVVALALATGALAYLITRKFTSRQHP